MNYSQVCERVSVPQVPQANTHSVEKDSVLSHVRSWDLQQRSSPTEWLHWGWNPGVITEPNRTLPAYFIWLRRWQRSKDCCCVASKVTAQRLRSWRPERKAFTSRPLATQETWQHGHQTARSSDNVAIGQHGHQIAWPSDSVTISQCSHQTVSVILHWSFKVNYLGRGRAHSLFQSKKI